MTDYSKASDAKVEIPEGITLTTFPAREHTPLVELEYPEFQSLCPVSERHDQGVATIRYKPKEKILEGKSLRDYLTMWRNKRNWQEYVTEEIADLLYLSWGTKSLTSAITWAARGGIVAKTTSTRGSTATS